MPPAAAPPPLSFDALKSKQRQIRSGFPEPLGLRVHRAISWFGRATDDPGDDDTRFILLWIGFNAAYAADLRLGPAETPSERSNFNAFFERLVRLDRENRIYGTVWTRFPQEIRVLLDNRYIYAPFWAHQNGEPGYADWESRLAASRRQIASALTARDTARILSTVFDRLYVLRNQLVHGGSTWNSSINRNQVRDGAAVLTCLLPIFIDIMMDHPTHDWGKPYYPVVREG